MTITSTDLANAIAGAEQALYAATFLAEIKQEELDSALKLQREARNKWLELLRQRDAAEKEAGR